MIYKEMGLSSKIDCTKKSINLNKNSPRSLAGQSGQSKALRKEPISVASQHRLHLQSKNQPCRKDSRLLRRPIIKWLYEKFNSVPAYKY